MAKLNNVEIHFKHSNRTYNTMTAFLVMGPPTVSKSHTPYLKSILKKVNLPMSYAN